MYIQESNIREIEDHESLIDFLIFLFMDHIKLSSSQVTLSHEYQYIGNIQL